MYESPREYWERFGREILKNHRDGYVLILPENGFDNRLKFYRNREEVRRDFPDYVLGLPGTNTIISLCDKMWKEAPRKEKRVSFSTKDFRWRAS